MKLTGEEGAHYHYFFVFLYIENENNRHLNNYFLNIFPKLYSLFSLFGCIRCWYTIYTHIYIKNSYFSFSLVPKNLKEWTADFPLMTLISKQGVLMIFSFVPESSFFPLPLPPFKLNSSLYRCLREGCLKHIRRLGLLMHNSS